MGSESGTLLPFMDYHSPKIWMNRIFGPPNLGWMMTTKNGWWVGRFFLKKGEVRVFFVITWFFFVININFNLGRGFPWFRLLSLFVLNFLETNFSILLILYSKLYPGLHCISVTLYHGITIVELLTRFKNTWKTFAQQNRYGHLQFWVSDVS